MNVVVGGRNERKGISTMLRVALGWGEKRKANRGLRKEGYRKEQGKDAKTARACVGDGQQ